MGVFGLALPRGEGALLAAAGIACVLSSTADAATPLAPHRAVYDMTLGTSRGGSSVTAVDGRLVYELTGSVCEGFTQTMRFVTRMGTQQGGTTINDLRSRTWENGDGTMFRFDSQTLRDEKLTESSVGEGARDPANGGVKVELSKPGKKTFETPRRVSFPVQHSRQLIAAAKAGQTRLSADLYDGSEQGEKIYDTIASIGAAIDPKRQSVVSGVTVEAPLDQMPAWPISISYFEPGSEKSDAVPVYELSFWFYENGVSRRLKIDYGEFAIEGDLKRIEFLPPKPCTPAR